MEPSRPRQGVAEEDADLGGHFTPQRRLGFLAFLPRHWLPAADTAYGLAFFWANIHTHSSSP
jgi:hypothetical protein